MTQDQYDTYIRQKRYILEARRRAAAQDIKHKQITATIDAAAKQIQIIGTAHFNNMVCMAFRRR